LSILLAGQVEREPLNGQAQQGVSVSPELIEGLAIQILP